VVGSGEVVGIGPNGPTATYFLRRFDGQATVSLRFQLQSDGSGTADGVSIDDVTIACEPVPGTYSGTEYAFARGTSFAAAYVSGAAALLSSACPTATAGQIRSALLEGVDALTSLAGKTVTGGRLNVYRSLGLLCATPSPR
jgi:thermitase